MTRSQSIPGGIIQIATGDIVTITLQLDLSDKLQDDGAFVDIPPLRVEYIRNDLLNIRQFLITICND